MRPRSARRGHRPVTAPGAMRLLGPVGVVRGSGTALALAAVLAWCSTGILLALPWAFGGTLAALLRGEPVVEPAAVLTVLTLGAYACQAGCGRLLAGTGEGVLLELRRRLAHHMLRLPLHDVRTRGAGDLGAQLLYDTAQVRAAMESGLVHLPAAVFGVLAVLVAMTRLDPQLTLLTVGSFTLAGGPLAVVLARTRRVAATQFQTLGRLNQRLLNCLQTLATIKTHRYETAAAATLERAAADYGAVSAAAGRLQAVVGPLVGLAQQLALTSVTVTAAHRVGAGTLSLQAASTFLLLLFCLASPLTVIALGTGQLRTGQAARRRLAALLASPAEADTPSPPGPARRPCTAARGAVTFHDVSFAHPDSAPVLSHVSFAVPDTGITLLVGPSGAGKSTALALITRLLCTDHGQIHVLGREVGSWPLPQLRRRVTFVEQHLAVWEGTIRDNLHMGCGPQASDRVLWDALDAVGLAEAVERLPQGLGTGLGGGRALSGGQCQRLSLARALLADADLLVLDEPTSQVDTDGEQHVFATLSRLAATRPVLMATHRPDSVRGAAHVITIAPPPAAQGSRRRATRPSEPVPSWP
ncbi:ATP-binding cassette domain-containing protein [Streptomyces sp. NPDC100445]|uniref:ATP-binding cassette domain-containing protein n=1 Tax=Streptomyces sp. NPDC100445 TaxID=3366102 RepID=UPI00381AFED2